MLPTQASQILVQQGTDQSNRIRLSILSVTFHRFTDVSQCVNELSNFDSKQIKT